MLFKRIIVLISVLQLDLQLPVQPVPTTTNTERLNLAHGEVYSIQHYVMKFVNDLRQGRWFSNGTLIKLHQ